MSSAAQRHAWLELLQVSGPFLTVPVADQVWPTALPPVATNVRADVRTKLAKLLSGAGQDRAELARAVFGTALAWGDNLVEGPALPATLSETVAEHGALLRPDFAFGAESVDEDEDDMPVEEAEEGDEGEDNQAPASARPGQGGDSPWKLLGMWVPWGRHPLVRSVEAGWAASPVERLAALLRARDVPVGLVSDGRWWALVWAPRGKPVGAAVWDASLWSEEPESLEAFVALLGRQRFLGVAREDRLPSLLQRSAEAQEEVTVALGGQVRAAVEMLVERLDDLDREAGGALLDGVSDDDLYAGVVTVMMRVLFLLFAEERRLLPSDDERYDTAYSVGRLVEQLEHRASLNGEQTLEHRSGAWHRLLAVARALHRGVAHEDMRLPPYGGNLFDPDRFPWLEGRGSKPPRVDDLTVLRVLEAVQYVVIKGERRRLSFRAVDVEQIGYVYEGLLELEVRSATEPVIKLRRQAKKGLSFIGLHEAELAAEDLETWAATDYIGEAKATPARLKAAARWLDQAAPAGTVAGIRQALGTLGPQLEPLAPLVRCNERGHPLITLVGGRFVAPSTRRASTGAHYTPRSLAEEVVCHTLEPLVYRPGPLETLEAAKWVLRPSSELLALRVADIAMGSGAFLVAACRYLADRLVEAWDTEGDVEATLALAQRTEQTADAEVAPVVLRARRQVAEHCLYGVDINPLAVEMAKLSLWLITMDKERPFGFLNDRLVCGDSLLGLTSVAQLEALHIDPGASKRSRHASLDFAAEWRQVLANAADTRRRITATPVVKVSDVEHKMRLLAEAQAATDTLQLVADALTGAGMRAAGLPVKKRNEAFLAFEPAVWALNGSGGTKALDRYCLQLDAGRPEGKEPRRPLHWPIEFPEIFADAATPGFDAIIGNPPFLGGQKISGALGADYLAWLSAWDGCGKKGSCDLAARFVLRTDKLLRPTGQLGYVTTNTLLEGDTLAVGLLQLEGRGWVVRRGRSAHPWPSTSANLSVVEVWASKTATSADAVLDDEPVPHLTVDLQPYLTETGRPERLQENDGAAFIGSYVLGLGFTMEQSEAEALIEEDAKNAEVLFPYVIGADLNRRPDCSASRWIINFQDWPLERAERYSLPMDRVRRFVKPERDRNKRQSRRERWWWYAERAPELYQAISGLDHVLAISLTSSTVAPVRVKTGRVFDQTCVVFALNGFANLALLGSSVHQCWVLRYGSTLETRIRYIQSNVFVTFPRPSSTSRLEELGETLDTERRELMLGRSLGLTKLYNQVHDPDVADPAIVRLREVHAEVDQAVLEAYGWADLDPGIGHHKTKIGTRWTVSPRARFELLDRLLVEDHRRAALERSRGHRG